MHEYVYADKILQSVLEETKEVKPLTVVVEVGEMLGLTKASLTTAYAVLAKGTRAEGSRLVVRLAKGSVRCSSCGFKGRLPIRRHEHRIDPAFACPKCGSSLQVESGLEVKLVRIS